VAGAEEGEEERLLLTRLYQNLNLLLLNDQALENQNPNLLFKANFETGKEIWSPETVEKPTYNIEDRASAVGEQIKETMDEI
jgi:hypothetical protein